MNRIIIKLALQSIFSNWVNSTINSIGFSLGIAASLFLFLFIRYETSFDTQYPDSEEIFRILVVDESENSSSTDGFVWFPVAEEAANNVASIHHFCRVTEELEQKVKQNNQWKSIKRLRAVDPNFFTFFNFKLIVGSPNTALDGSDKIVLTEEYAKRLFGNENPLGQQVMYNHKLLTVSGIAANPPPTTHLVYDALISLQNIEENNEIYKEMGGGIMLLSYIKVKKSSNLHQIEKQIDNTVYKEINKKWQQFGSQLTTALQPITAIHISDGKITYDCETNRSFQSILLVVAIAMLILLLSVVNYITLFSAQKLGKSKTMALMKMYGADKLMLSRQLFVEIFLLTLFSSIIGLLLFIASLPSLNQLFQTALLPSEEGFPIIVFLLLTALLLSLIITIIVIKNGLLRASNVTLKEEIMVGVIGKRSTSILITFQFTTVIALLISIFVIYLQNRELLNRPVGFDKGQLLCLQSEEGFSKQELASFKQTLSQFSDIEKVSLTSQNVGNGMTQNGYAMGDEENLCMLNALYTDRDFFSCFGIALTKGKNFSELENPNRSAIIINEQLYKRTGESDLQQIKIRRNGPLEVIGVVNDFNFQSLEQEVQPILIMVNPKRDGWDYSTINIRTNAIYNHQLQDKIAKIWEEQFPDTPFVITPLEDNLADNYVEIERQKKVIGLFSLLALFIAIIGLFGVTLFALKNRIKEIGIRKVNGANNWEILLYLNTHFLKCITLSFLIATPLSYFIMNRWIQGFAYRIALSWWIFALAGILALSIALLTVSWQSWRAARRNPVDCLRDE